jgi:CubicO group peptidase (beta-lactamase class C family)
LSIDFITYMRDVDPPVMPPFETTLYSDGGYGVLGRVLERLTNQTYSEALQSLITQPLGLNSTSVYLPQVDFNALAFPANVTSWGVDNQVTAP